MAAATLPATWSQQRGWLIHNFLAITRASKWGNVDFQPRLHGFAVPCVDRGTDEPMYRVSSGFWCWATTTWEELKESKDFLMEQRGTVKGSSIFPGSVSPSRCCVAGRCASDRSSCVTVKSIPMIIHRILTCAKSKLGGNHLVLPLCHYLSEWKQSGESQSAVHIKRFSFIR